MKRIPILVVATIAVCAIALITVAASGADDEAAPIFGIKIPPGYRDWKLISVAHEEGNLNDLRAVLGNEVAIKAYREGKLPFPDGTIIARLAWSYVPSEENNKVSRLSSPMRSAFGGQSELKRCAGAGRGRGK
jgi:Cytochrome P460